ncbi:MAG TPA: hypothetical protein VFF06_17650 [Polyangia bacterium]|nr:hypothetical protein [Polyangia bacterium]
MKIKLVIRYANADHRFLKSATVELSGATPGAKKPGEHVFELPDGTSSAELRVRVPTPGKAALDLKQSLVIKADADPFMEGSGARWGRALDPRLKLKATRAKKGKGALAEITVDTRFLDLTDYLTDGGYYQYDKAKNNNVELRVFEYTAANARPLTWAVLIPTQAQSAKDVGVVLFMRPATEDYVATETLEFTDRIFRYFFSPPPDYPFFGQLFDKDASPPKAWEPYPLCGFTRQLAEAGKKAVLVFPLPDKSANWGDAANKQLLPLLRSLVNGLWAADSVGKSEKSGVKLSRLALAPYSSAGGAAFGSLVRNQSDIDELYLFDPNLFRSKTKLIGDWLKAKAGRKLRMVGEGENHAAMLQLKAQQPSDAVTAYPSRANYWQTSNLYRGAIRVHVKTRTGRLAVQPISRSGAAKSELTDATGIYVFSDAAAVDLVLVDENGGKATTFADCSAEEATFFLLASWVKNKSTIQKGDFAAWIATLKDPIKNAHNIRHQWPVVGGIASNDEDADSADRGAAFKGYLQLFLEKSGF